MKDVSLDRGGTTVKGPRDWKFSTACRTAADGFAIAVGGNLDVLEWVFSTLRDDDADAAPRSTTAQQDMVWEGGLQRRHDCEWKATWTCSSGWSPDDSDGLQKLVCSATTAQQDVLAPQSWCSVTTRAPVGDDLSVSGRSSPDADVTSEAGILGDNGSRMCSKKLVSSDDSTPVGDLGVSGWSSPPRRRR
ncbi:hypothetical protein PC129_g1750 [Phytophthora cactorum]|uniref:Uncharacterized protein n=1 Tax=Phytophthora cactorum TaxID=29920 RepID=A0A8T1DEU5_9STRA|nr:hypothetical protein PC112_g22101 [Phytophthora cactorum]KAG2799838.1 hypothetical protein PC111_g20247 [Phytophthora cactorum]KAG2824382.1 hypothetical protein PC113_g22046 [Phytophthora cactorum]KAG2876191.1 hypothetical protein PC114_g24331 [Phytophthora cactorum]KAG2890435.1 hypothetical protein PC117_g24461 [Phytophthora cactorum]